MLRKCDVSIDLKSPRLVVSDQKNFSFRVGKLMQNRIQEQRVPLKGWLCETSTYEASDSLLHIARDLS